MDISDDTKKEMALRDAARTLAKGTNSDTDWDNYKMRRNKCTDRQRKDKNLYMRNMYEKMEREWDSARLFATTKHLMGWKQPKPPVCFLNDGIPHRKQQDLANIQIDFYENKVNKIKKSLPQVNTDPVAVLRRQFERWIPAGGRPKFLLKSVTEKEVLEMIGKLKVSHAFGIDRIDASTIKLLAPILTPPITHIINLSLGTGTFPAKWKLARVLPLLKSRDLDTSNPGLFRPVCQLPIISKLTERAYRFNY